MEKEALQNATTAATTTDDVLVVLGKEKYDVLDKKIMKLKRRVERQCRRTYAVNRVFVTYELEQAQRHCIRELEVADYVAIFNIHDNQGSKLFRNEVLDVEEPAEPDTIIWENLKIAKKDRLYYDTRGLLVTGEMMMMMKMEMMMEMEMMMMILLCPIMMMMMMMICC
jgi:predicted RND superfamily exporter protein